MLCGDEVVGSGVAGCSLLVIARLSLACDTERSLAGAEELSLRGVDELSLAGFDELSRAGVDELSLVDVFFGDGFTLVCCLICSCCFTTWATIVSVLHLGFLVDVPRLKSHISHLNFSAEFLYVHRLQSHQPSSPFVSLSSAILNCDRLGLVWVSKPIFVVTSIDWIWFVCKWLGLSLAV